eukprot:6624835-Pyramimonas_sp.AAC.1
MENRSLDMTSANSPFRCSKHPSDPKRLQGQPKSAPETPREAQERENSNCHRDSQQAPKGPERPPGGPQRSRGSTQLAPKIPQQGLQQAPPRDPKSHPRGRASTTQAQWRAGPPRPLSLTSGAAGEPSNTLNLSKRFPMGSRL